MTKEKMLKIFSHLPVIKTERLILRAVRPTDANDVHEYSSDPEVPKFLLWNPHDSFSFTERYLQKIKIDYRIGKYYDWAIVINEGTDKGKMIGTCGFTSFDLQNNSAEVGYVINRRFWGQGIAAEALRAVIAFGFETLILRRIEAKYIDENINSRKVMEKCGMTFEGIIRSSMMVKGEYRNIGICSILSDEYIASKQLN